MPGAGTPSLKGAGCDVTALLGRGDLLSVDGADPSVEGGQVRKPRAGFTMSRALLCCWIGGIPAAALLPLVPGAALAASARMPVASISPNTAENNILYSVSCASASECWTVGQYQVGSIYQTLVEKWDGSSWSIVSSPNAGAQSNWLDSVTCASLSECWAVGWYDVGSIYQTLIEGWDGSSWSIVSSPNLTSSQDRLLSVACESTSECWAVGDSLGNGDPLTQTLIQEYNGTAWSVVASADLGSAWGSLSGVTCVSASECWAVGYSTTDKNATLQTLVEYYDGIEWSLEPSGNSSDAYNELTGVACTSANRCWAVGFTEYSGGGRTLIEYYDGSTWSVFASPGLTTLQNNLFAVTCTSSSDCWAVGSTYTPGEPELTLTEQYNGTSWSVVSAVNPSSDDNTSSGVACISASECWMVGIDYNSAGPIQALIENWNGTSWTVNVDESSPSVVFDTWKGNLDLTASGGTYRSSGTKGATATFKFTGTGITWVTRKGPFQGIASVAIDGKSKGNVDLYAATSQSFSQGYSGLSSKKHTIVIKVTGTKDAASGNTNAAVDAFIVGLTTTQETSPKVTYDSWAGGTSASASGGTYRTDGKAKATSGLTFTGTGVTWVTATGPSEGKATVTVDGSLVETVDLYSPTVDWQVAEPITGLTSGSHTILITVLGTKDAASAGKSVVVDAFVVDS
jgi:hypothetical protein